MILKYKCAICNKVFETRKKLCTNIQWSHKIAGKEYYDTYISDTTDHKCIVCGKNDTEFLNIDDGTDNVNKVIIEYNGDYWHPKCLNDPEWKNNRLDCNETWIYNENKKLCAERNGYKIYYIWEHDVNECYSECLSKCKLALEGKI